MDPEKIAEEIKELGAHIDELRGRVDSGVLTATEFEERMVEVGKDYAERFVDFSALETMAKRLDEIEAHAARLRANQEEAGVDDELHVAAWRDVLRTGNEHPDAAKPRLDDSTREFLASDEYKKYCAFGLETRTLTEGVDTAGGLFVPPSVVAGILKNVVDIDPVRSVANVMGISGSDRQKGYRRTGVPTSAWETETGSGSDSEATWAPYEIPVHAHISKTPVSGDLLADVAFIESEVQSDAGQAFGYTEGVAFVEGHGAGQPMGFTTNVGLDNAIYPASVASTGAGASDAVQANDIPKMWGSLKAPYRANAYWAFNSTTFISLLSLKDGNNRYYLLADGGLVAGPPTRMYGKPFIVCETLADEGSDTYPLWFGDFRMGYRIVDRSGIQLLRDIYTVWPKVYFKMRKRVGGQVVKAEAIKGLLTT